MASRSQKRTLIGLLIVIIFLAAAGILASRYLRRAGPLAISFESSYPGAAVQGFIYDDPEIIERLQIRASTLLLTEQGWISSLRIEGPELGQPAEPTMVLNAMDQLAASRAALEGADLTALRAELARIRSTLINEDGLVAAATTVNSDGTITRSNGFANAPTLAWLRLLAETYQETGSPEVLQELRTASDAFLARVGPDGLLPADTDLMVLKQPPPPDPEATPTPRPSSEPTPVVESIRRVIRIADIDLYAIQLLQPLDERWHLVFNRSRTLLENAVLTGPEPLFQYAYDPGIEDYIGFDGTQPVIDTEDSLAALLHLYEAGGQLPQTLTYLRNRFYETSVLPEQINRATGAAVDDSECIAGYALLARIARITADHSLYERAAERLIWHTATNTRSEAYGAVFRTDPDSRVRVTARDNLLAVLALASPEDA